MVKFEKYWRDSIARISQYFTVFTNIMTIASHKYFPVFHIILQKYIQKYFM